MNRVPSITPDATLGARPVDLEELKEAHEIASEHGIPLYVGSGSTLKNLSELKRLTTGIIVGSALRRGGRAGAPLDPRALKAFSTAYHRGSGKPRRKGRASGRA